MTQQIGKQSLRFHEAPFILNSASIAGTKEAEGPLGDKIDILGGDDNFGAEKWEEAESTLQKEALTMAMGKAGVSPEEVRYLFAGDLLGQTIATSFGLLNFEIPLFGVYGACSTAGESLGLASMTVAGGYADLTAAVTSSHFASAEKQFRFPLEYANQRPLCATWTVTGSGAFLLCNEKYYREHGTTEPVRITGITTGKIVDYGVKDSMNMGAAMAPAAADTIYAHLEDNDRNPAYYDKIVTGDLGSVGQEILIELLRQRGVDISKVHTDCGLIIYDNESQGTGSGGSGCGCSAVTLSAHFLPLLREREMKRILFVPTGALLSKISFNEGQNVPGIAHAVAIEVPEGGK